MPHGLISVLIYCGLLLVGGLAGFFIGRHLYEKMVTEKTNAIKLEAQNIIEDAKAEARDVILSAKSEGFALRSTAEEEIKRQRQSVQEAERRFDKRRADLEERMDRLEKRERRLNRRQSGLDKRANDLKSADEKHKAKLEKISQLSQEEAKDLLLEEVSQTARQDMARIIRSIEDEANATASQKAQKILAWAIQRIATEHVADMVVTAVPLPSEDMKGRIIGRNGRNIRAFEQAAGVDVIVDDTPEAVTISCFSPVRRETARRAMEKLVLDGRIHPSRVEKLIEDSRAEVEQDIQEAGESAAMEAGVHGLRPPVIQLLGRLKYRTSYGQNQLRHSVETAHIATLLAAELGANIEVAKAGGLLHDIGKAIDHEVEGTHAALGAEICRRHNVPQAIVHTIASHHHEIDQDSTEAIIVEVADAISGARPGARRESLESYLRRIKTLEEVAKSFGGVSEAFALQAGREVRIIVKPEEIDDLAAVQLSRNIARQVEEMMQYPGQIKVTVIREMRAVDYAK